MRRRKESNTELCFGESPSNGFASVITSILSLFSTVVRIVGLDRPFPREHILPHLLQALIGKAEGDVTLKHLDLSAPSIGVHVKGDGHRVVGDGRK